MPGTLEERVAYIEGRVEEHSKAWEDLKDMIINLDHKVDTKIDSLDQRFSSRMDSLDQKVDRFRDELSSKIDSLDQKVDRFRDELSSKTDSLDQKFSRYFLCIIGIQVTIFLSIIVTLLRS
ncbi:MAG: hypothetical protein JRI71_15360 [Deltaproteobacteria bacterium]|nr:hypothetical protein [Deltaproteobacteria bacterium]